MSGSAREAIDLTRVLCRLDELAASGCREFRLGAGAWPLKGFVVQLAASGAGAASTQAQAQVRAYLNRCPHRALPLNLLPDRFLSPDGSVIVCAMHGAIFEKRTGLCVAGPCPGAALRALPVRLVGGFVLLDESVDAARLLEQI